MIMADILAVLSGLILIGLAFPSLIILLSLIFPQAVENARELIGEKPKRLLLKGAFTFIIIFVCLIILGNASVGPLKLIGLILILTGFSFSMIGGAGLVKQLSWRYKEISGSDQPLKNIIISSLMLELATALPIVGWFVVLPLSFLIMLGAGYETFLYSLTKRAKSSATDSRTAEFAKQSTN
jgi:hypothetical protein